MLIIYIQVVKQTLDLPEGSTMKYNRQKFKKQSAKAVI